MSRPRRGLIGMRFNMPRRELQDMIAAGVAEGSEPAEKWVRLSKALQAFNRSPQSWARLESVGISQESLVWRGNLLPPAPQGVKWDAAMAKRIATRTVRRYCMATDLVFLCGRDVWRAFGATGQAGDVVELTRQTVGLLVPHPSGLNRWWNEAENVEALRTRIESITNLPFEGGPA